MLKTARLRTTAMGIKSRNNFVLNTGLKSDILHPLKSVAVASKGGYYLSSIHPRFKKRGFLEGSNKPD